MELKLKHKKTGNIAYRKGNFFIKQNGYCEKLNEKKWKKLLIKWDIHSVKRLSDGEIFTLHDRYTDGGVGSAIWKFTIMHNEIYVCDTCNTRLEDIKKVKNPIFTTEDEVPLYARIVIKIN